jgi:hypothetical protein
MRKTLRTGLILLAASSFAAPASAQTTPAAKPYQVEWVYRAK